MPTIYEVAAQAGVSPATVSRVFNGQNVSAERSRRVREVAEALGFTPNRVARTLRLQNSEVIALVIPDIENPFFTSLARGVEDVAQAAGYSVVLCNTDEDQAKEARYLDIALSANMAGVILAAAGDHSDLDALIRRGRPIVAVDRGPHGYDIDAVMVDSRAGGRAATKALADQGYRRIACITGPAGASTSEDRLAGYRAAMHEAGAADDWTRAYTRHADFRVDGGYAAMRELLGLPTPPDAAFVANNLMTVGALQALRQAGIEPPDFGILSFGDVPWASLVRPPLTTVQLPSYDLGASAAALLQDRLARSDKPLQTVVLRTVLQPRESTDGPATRG
jgi:LacI family transcriptional regulator